MRNFSIFVFESLGFGWLWTQKWRSNRTRRALSSDNIIHLFGRFLPRFGRFWPQILNNSDLLTKFQKTGCQGVLVYGILEKGGQDVKKILKVSSLLQTNKQVYIKPYANQS